VELAITDDAIANDLMTALDPTRFGALIDAVHTYPIKEIFTIVHAGRPTHVGLRGYHPTATIAATGASAQLDPEMLEIIYGDAVLGIERVP
jgi:hypothetical protein